MSLRKLPEIKNFARPENFKWDAPSDVMSKWAEAPMPAAAAGNDVISIFDVIGEDFWSGGGFTAKRAAAALRSIGNKPVTVQINSPGGDMFEGIAIYNLLRQHPEKVTVQVMGWAASVASIIAMAGDEISMGLGSFMMIHNAWGVVIGNRHDMRGAADLFDGFDAALVDIYEARTSTARAEIETLMDAETFMGPSEAIKRGFADVVDESLTEVKNLSPGLKARRQTEAALAKAGLTRSQRTDLLSELLTNTAERDAGRAERDAGNLSSSFASTFKTIRS